jgi:hypothetical protein
LGPAVKDHGRCTEEPNAQRGQDVYTGPGRRWAALAVAVMAFFSACSIGPETTPSRTSTPAGGLSKACGPKLVLQTDWFPEPEHGGSYQLIGPSGRVDGERGTYSGEIGHTGVELEIRAGGPYIGNQQVTSLMYQDDDIFMGYVNTDEAVRYSGKLPTVAVFAPLANSPSALMWNPAKYSFKSLADIGKSHAKVLYFEGTAFVDYLVGKGFIHRSQLDASYDGSPSRFVAEGDIVQEAFATNEPYRYEHDIPQWRRPVDFLLVNTSGYEPYPQNIAVRPKALRERQACLRALVPLMQQAQVDYIRNPQPVNDALLRIVDELASSWTLSKGSVSDAVKKMIDLKIVANGPDGAIGGFDMTRIDRVIGILEPIYVGQKVTTMKPDVGPNDIATNKFIDLRIRLS